MNVASAPTTLDQSHRPSSENPITGERVEILVSPEDSDGAKFVADFITKPHKVSVVGSHVHTQFVERVEVISGTGCYKLGDTTHTVKVGDIINLPPFMPHRHPWNIGDDDLHVRQTTVLVHPDLDGLMRTLRGVETINGLVREGKVNPKNGLPNILQLAVILQSFWPHTYLAGIPIPLQIGLLGPLALIGYAQGYRASYPQYNVL